MNSTKKNVKIWFEPHLSASWLIDLYKRKIGICSEEVLRSYPLEKARVLIGKPFKNLLKEVVL